MKQILATLILLPLIAAGQYWHPDSGYLPTLPSRGYGLNPLTEGAFLGPVGGYRATAPTIPEGEYLVGVEWSLVDGVYVPANVVTAAFPTLPPDPDVTVPLVDTNGNVTGTARILVDEELNIVAVVDSASPQKPIEEQLEQFHQRRKIEAATRRAVQRTVATSIPEDAGWEEVEDVADLFRSWAVDAKFVRWEFFWHNEILYRASQDFTGAAQWEPGGEGLEALFVEIPAPGESGCPPWVQPGGHNPYMAGACVEHAGQVWDNVHGDGNVWVPGEYGWVAR